MGGIEHLISQGGERNRSGDSAVVRQFTVVGATASQIRSAPQSVTLDDGSTLPGLDSTFDGMKLDRITADPIGGAVDVKYYYSSGGRFNFQQPAPITPEGVSFKRSGAITTVQDPIPYAVRTFSTVAIDGQNIRIPFWQITSQNVLTSMFRLSFTVRIDTGIAGSATFAAMGQLNKIHYLPTDESGVWARFEGADYVETQPDVYAYTYSWLVDGGVPWRPEFEYTEGDNFILPPVVTSPYFPDKDWLRPPFHRVIAIPADPSVEVRNPPTFEYVGYQEFYANGWNQLYGLTNPS